MNEHFQLNTTITDSLAFRREIFQRFDADIDDMVSFTYRTEKLKSEGKLDDLAELIRAHTIWMNYKESERTNIH